MEIKEQLELKAKLFQKLLEVKKKVVYLSKDTKGFNFEYASPEKVLGTFNPILNEIGLFLKTEVVDVKYDRVFSKKKTNDVYVDGKKQTHVVDAYETLYHLTMRYTWVDSETGYEDSSLFSASGINNDEQGQGSAQTYAERYFLLKTFNVATGKDDPDALGVKRNTSTPTETAKSSPSVPSNLPYLNQGTENYTKVEKAISEGKATIKDVKTKYKLSKAVEESLTKLVK